MSVYSALNRRSVFRPVLCRGTNASRSTKDCTNPCRSPEDCTYAIGADVGVPVIDRLHICHRSGCRSDSTPLSSHPRVPAESLNNSDTFFSSRRGKARLVQTRHAGGGQAWPGCPCIHGCDGAFIKQMFSSSSHTCHSEKGAGTPRAPGVVTCSGMESRRISTDRRRCHSGQV